MAKALVADMQDRQAVPVEHEQQHLHARPHRLDAVDRQPDLLRDLQGPRAVQPLLALEQVVRRQHRRRVALGQDGGQVGGGPAGGHESLHVAVGGLRQLAQGGPAHTGALFRLRRVGEVRAGEHARAYGQRRPPHHLARPTDRHLG